MKLISSLFCLFTLSCSFLFGGMPAPDKLDFHSQSAQIKLSRAKNLLSTIVPNSHQYHLVLSSNPHFGGEAVPPYVFSDKPSIIVYQGSLSPDRSNEELTFMLAHELGHINLQHMQNMDRIMEGIFTGPPIGISGTTFSIFYQKFQEREADLYGLDLYHRAGYDLNFFPATYKQVKFNPDLHYGKNRIIQKPLSSLSMKNSHFSMEDRFELLVQESQKLA